ncbi:hypothetical protein ACPUEK_08355 [Marinomonas gallaica]|uniref:hypothetical protein n=1 Tax=Marinomonas gallaica TaxID=1806667 RepID=UPI003CE4A729
MFKRSLTRTLVLITSLIVLTACGDNSANPPKEVPFAERPIASESERDQLILDLSNFYLASLTDLVSNYNDNKKRDPSIYIDWRNKEWLPSYTEQKEQLFAKVNHYQIGAVDKDFAPLRSALESLSLISELFERSLSKNDPFLRTEIMLQLQKGASSIIQTARSRNLEGRLIFPEELSRRIPK